MSRNGSGTYSPPVGQPVVTGTVISSSVFNALVSDVGNELTNSLPRDGQAPPTANIPMGNYKFTGMANGSAATDSATVGQIQGNTANWAATSGGSANAQTLTPSPAITVLTAGQSWGFIAGFTNTGPATLAVSGLTAKNVFVNQAALTGGEIVAGRVYNVVYDGTQYALKYGEIRQVPVNVDDYGAVGNNTANDAPAFALATTYLNAVGGGTLTGSRGKTYKIVPTISSVVCDFSNCKGITIDMSDSLINDTQTYTGTQEATLFKFTACDDIDINYRLTSAASVTTSTTVLRGITGVQLYQGCDNVRMNIDQVGGLVGLAAIKLFSDAASYKSRNITGKLRVSGCYYPYSGQFSGDLVDLMIDSDTCGRSFFIYGVSNNNLNLRVKNQQVTSIISAYSGYGCSDINVKMVDLDSDTNQSAAGRIAINYEDTTTAEMKNIVLDVDLKNPSGSPFGHAITINKYNGGAGDNTQRAHVLDNLLVKGRIDNTGVSVNHVTTIAGLFTGTDSVRNVRCEDFNGIGVDSSIDFSSVMPVLAGRSLWTGVTCGTSIFTGVNPSGSEVIFLGCTAKNFTASTSEASRHQYLNCNATVGLVQSRTNKRFQNTLVNGVLYNDTPETGRNSCLASTSRSGSQTGTNNIFKITTGGGIGFYARLRYALVADGADTNPGTRDETVGVKSFTATISGSGVVAIQQAVADEVTERTLGTASVLTVTGVNGGTVDVFGETFGYGYIAVAATNYSGSGAKAAYSIEIVQMFTDYIVSVVPA